MSYFSGKTFLLFSKFIEKLPSSSVKHHFSQESPLHPHLFAGHQADELVPNYSTTTARFITLCSQFSFHKSLSSALEDTDIKSHDKALL